jgi:hypothetical protein
LASVEKELQHVKKEDAGGTEEGGGRGPEEGDDGGADV